ncbi:hypothetical protein HYU40_04300 [Candidatus Woesearchaeota archaeon]|nr:hypothetical protein [Candidatus Woesearchaeota archaeon]
MSKDLDGIIKEVYVLRDDHAIWTVTTVVYVESSDPGVSTFSLYEHGGIDKGPKQLFREYFNKLGKIGLPDARDAGKEFGGLASRLDEIYNLSIPQDQARVKNERQELETKLAKLNQRVTKALNGVPVVVNVTPWPLRSTQSYKVTLNKKQ